MISVIEKSLFCTSLGRPSAVTFFSGEVDKFIAD